MSLQILLYELQTEKERGDGEGTAVCNFYSTNVCH